MVLKRLLTDDTAVSPVIGVILMVAITVLLAAVVGSFALGIPDQAEPGTEIPQTSFTFEYDDSASGGITNLEASDSGSNGRLTITHESGETIDANDIEIRDKEGDTPVDGSSLSSSELTAGTSIDIRIGSDDTILIVYVPDGVDTSSVIQEYEAPDA